MSMMPLIKKSNKKPVPDAAHDPEVVQDIFGDFLGVDPAVAEDIESRGWEKRWIDAKQMVQNSGFHRRGWEVYKIPDGLKLRNSSVMGIGPDKDIRRGTLVLGVRSTQLGDAHRRELAARNRVYKALPAQKMKALREHARAQGIDTKLHEDDD